jgi:1,4-dihydroxy-2-naphthoate octaprenyltransferase
VDKDNTYRSQYGPQPLVHGLMSKKELLRYAAVTGLLALAAGAVLVYARGSLALVLLGLGAFFVLFYTFPLKYIALGEIAVLIVWGPLMIGGGYYAITGVWDWNVVIASLPYALGVTTVIFGKHIDKVQVDKDKHIQTLPVLLGEQLARASVVAMTVLQYVSVLYLVLTGFFTPVLLIVFLALTTFFKVFWAMYRRPRPEQRPQDYPAEAWPLWFVASAFVHNRRFGLLYLLGLILDTLLRRILLV